MEVWADWIYRIIMLLLVGGGFFWMKERLKVMQTTVEGQKTLLQTMDTVLKSTDEQTMLARLKAHKEFVDHEKEAASRRLAEQHKKEKARLLAGTWMSLDAVFERLTKN